MGEACKARQPQLDGRPAAGFEGQVATPGALVHQPRRAAGELFVGATAALPPAVAPPPVAAAGARGGGGAQMGACTSST